MKSILHNAIIYLFALILCFSCKRTSVAEVETVFLSPDMEIEVLSDSTFFKRVQCISEYDGDIYMSLDQRMQILRMDKDCSIKATIGGYGRGPGEFTFMNSFFVYDDEIWAGNTKDLAYSRFTIDGKFMGVEEKSHKLFSFSRFFIEDNKIYFQKYNHQNKSSLVALNLNKNDDYIMFGAVTEFQDEFKTGMENRRLVFGCKDCIIAVPEGLPFIEKYNRNTLELMEVFDVLNIPMVDVLYQEKLNHPQNLEDNVMISIMRDAYLHGNMLHVIYNIPKKISDEEKRDSYSCHVFDISGDITYVKRYMLDEPGSKICITDDYMYCADNSNSVLKRYPLKQ